MSTFPVEPPVTPAAPAPEAGGAAHRRELSQEEIATLPLQALLVRAGHITLDQLADALRENVATGRSVEDIALSRGWLSAEQLDALRAANHLAEAEPAGAVVLRVEDMLLQPGPGHTASALEEKVVEFEQRSDQIQASIAEIRDVLGELQA